MSWIRSGLVVSIAVCGALAVLPRAARAEGVWPWPVTGPVALEYGARYTDGHGRSCSHGGIDIAIGAGTTVVACAPGEVAFSGLVPAGEGNRAWAVTVLTDDGLRVTYLPLARASVGRGESVAAGETLGELSGSGDVSGAAAHLHLGVRRGERALDPLAFLAAAPSAAQPGRAVAPAPAPVKPPTSTAPAPRAQSQSPRAPASPPVVSRAPVSAPAARVGSAHSSAAVPSRTPAIVPVAPMPGLEALRRIAPIADSPRVRTAAVSADVGRLRDFLAAALVRLALAGVAAACSVPVMRGVFSACVHPITVPVTIRHDGA